MDRVKNEVTPGADLATLLFIARGVLGQEGSVE